jgi:hypothetical protein
MGMLALTCASSSAQAPRVLKAQPVEEPARPVVAQQPLKRVSVTIAGIALDGVAFDARSHRLVVADQPQGPGSKWPDSAAAGRQHGGLAAINAGFFTPSGEALGSVVSQGKVAGVWNGESSLGSAIWFEDGKGRSGIARRNAFGRAAVPSMRELVQAGPLLVEKRRAVGGLNDQKASARSVLLWDGGQRWLLARAAPCTLADLAHALAAAEPAGWPVKTALNLDGGRSAELWISDQIPGGPAIIRPFWNTPVRNFLILLPRR